jgi:hypothetical protein
VLESRLGPITGKCADSRFVLLSFGLYFRQRKANIAQSKIFTTTGKCVPAGLLKQRRKMSGSGIDGARQALWSDDLFAGESCGL